MKEHSKAETRNDRLWWVVVALLSLQIGLDIFEHFYGNVHIF